MMSMKKLASGVALGALMLASASAVYAQETTGGLRGQITDENGQGVAGATVSILHQPTGTRSTVLTGSDGFFTARALRVGGPYQVSVTAGGYEPAQSTVPTVGVGEPVDVDLTVLSAGGTVSELVVTASVAPRDSGSGSRFSESDIESLPSISRDLKDIARLDPFATIDPSNEDALSFAGTNTRLNQLTVDGIRQNDEFGLNGNGYPTQRSPISLDAIESVTASAAPFSVINNGFIGGSINAVTKSGTNAFSGSVFYEKSDDSLLGDRYWGYDNRTFVNGAPNLAYGSKHTIPYNRVFDEKTWGATLGGPIWRDRVFFFAAYEKYESQFSLDEGPTGAGFPTEVPRITAPAIETFRTATKNRYGYDPGSFVTLAPPVQDEKYLGKIDWNITDDHRLALTFQETKGTSFNGSTSTVFPNGDSLSATTPRVGLESTQYLKDERLTTYNAQLNSQWTENFSTELRVAYKETETTQLGPNGFEVGQVTVNVNDLPGVQAGPPTSTAQIQFGADNFRHDNYLYSENLNVELIGRYSWGAHDIMVGARTEKRDFLNVFVAQSQGTWTFGSYADFLAGKPASLFIRGAVDPTGGTVPASFGTARDGAVLFGYDLHSLYAEDVWQATDDLRVSGGVRYDWFAMDDRPVLNNSFVGRQGFANTANLDGRDLIMPRLSFSWTPGEWQVSGGIGRFSTIGTNVQVGNPFGNDGARITNSVCTGIGGATGVTGITDLTTPPPGRCTFTPGNGNVVALDPNFKIPSAWKYNLSVGRDVEAPWLGLFRVQADLIYNDFENALYYTDLRALQIGTAPDGRPVYGRNPRGAPAGTANEWDLMLSNTKDGGQSVSAAFTLQKSWNEGIFDGLDITSTYTYTEAEDKNPMTSSQPDSSYVRFAATDHNNPVKATSDYEIRHRFSMNAHWEREFLEDAKTEINVFAQVRSGLPFSYVYMNSRSGNFDNDFGNVIPQSYSGAFGTSNHLFYVPQTDGSGRVTATSDPRVTYSGIDLNAFNGFLANTGLIKYSGRAAPRNAFRSEPITTIDLRLSQEIPVPYLPTGKVKVYMDVENFGNLINKKWGVTEQYPFYRGVGTVVLQCQTPGGAAASCAAPGAVFNYSALQNVNSPLLPANAIPGLADQARRPQVVLPASTWQIKVGVRFEF